MQFNHLYRAMLSVAVTVVCFVCYCCHRNLRKRTESVYRQRWMENDPNMDIYSVEQVRNHFFKHTVMWLLSSLARGYTMTVKVCVDMPKTSFICVYCTRRAKLAFSVFYIPMLKKSTKNQNIHSRNINVNYVILILTNEHNNKVLNVSIVVMQPTTMVNQWQYFETLVQASVP